MSYKGIEFEVVETYSMVQNKVLLLRDKKELFIRVVNNVEVNEVVDFTKKNFIDFRKGDKMLLTLNSPKVNPRHSRHPALAPAKRETHYLREILHIDDYFIRYNELISGNAVKTKNAIMPIFNLTSFSKISMSIDDAELIFDLIE
jgi:hypothetical protein